MPVEEVAVEAGHAAGPAHGLDAVVHLFFLGGGGAFFVFFSGVPESYLPKCGRWCPKVSSLLLFLAPPGTAAAAAAAAEGGLRRPMEEGLLLMVSSPK